MISPWTAVVVHALISVKAILFILGCFATMFLWLGILIKNFNIKNNVIFKTAIVILALSITALVLIPSTEALARLFVVEQLPTNTDIEVIDKIVKQVCVEAKLL